MKYHVIINSVKTVDELKDAWNNADYIALLEKFGLDGIETSSTSELIELLHMAISDFEPEEAAQIILTYKLSEQLNENQIEQISHEMLLDKISEEYADISLHHQLFNINQLLHKAYNGNFPNAKATIVEFEITPNKEVTKEFVLKALDKTLANNNIIKRLFSDQLAGNEEFEEAEAIVWDLKSTGENAYTLTTSEYWMSRDEFKDAEFDVTVVPFEEVEH
ncbi:hypothetical protein DFQ11_107138 [Winogradskyella epiphytica]|uniref:Uncharacterized protein n=1 Tax=Winogradskyella epiphytica TaxID=262005 RepID=A0A2V4WU14_9FLAO|nr:hypothetical protein [Winogradskyella epiphytica]PYE80166.1 hypothetical protein DFQ11_107138 [Winogradskyella epiphytica]GGW71771.1 hypothetical protein GCM10008085_24990 [Winogradskyella epiphytica]